MKPSRKLNRGSFMSRVSGGTPKPMAGPSKAAVESDHDLVQPPSGPGADPGASPR